jgi:hypothetical protein
MTQQQQTPRPVSRPDLPNPAQQPPQRRPSRRLLRSKTAIISAVVVGGLALWAVLSIILMSLAGSMHPTTHTVLYEATADAYTGSGRSGMLTLETEAGGSSQAVVDLPFSGTSTTFHRGDFLYLSVQNQQPAGSVTCRITVDGVVVSENTSTGGYVIATCQGRMP